MCLVGANSNSNNHNIVVIQVHDLQHSFLRGFLAAGRSTRCYYLEILLLTKIE